jgi:hypothetical protein
LDKDCTFLGPETPSCSDGEQVGMSISGDQGDHFPEQFDVQPEEDFETWFNETFASATPLT